MSYRNLFASILMTCLLVTGFCGLAPTANALPMGATIGNHGEGAGDRLITVKNGVSIYLPVGPSSRYYDYSYYYSRGYYPTHIGGYVYYNPKTYNPEYEPDFEGVPYSAKERCDRRYRSFEWDTGLYTTYRGYKKLCPYLR